MRRRHALPARPRGLTLVELMVSLALGLLVVLVATGLLLSTRTGYLTQDDEIQLHDSARYALELIARSVRQSAYENWDTATAPVVATETMSANMAGLNASRLTSNGTALEKLGKPVINGSDVLAVRFFGSGVAPEGDGTMLNCAGFPVAAPSSQETAAEERGWSIFYVAKAGSGDLELYCKYLGKSGKWAADAIVRGVESFQVLYGVDTNGDGLPDRYMHAGAVDALDGGLTLEGTDAAAQALDLNRKTYWKKVLVVRIALLMRGRYRVRTDATDRVYDLFGAAYADAYSATDPGVRLSESMLPAGERNRPRRVFSATIQLRNRAAGGGA
jgi:type IV pilus assembly protein PilW